MPETSPAVTAEEVAPLFNCSARHVVDRLSKEPCWPSPIKRRPLTWTLDRVLQAREVMQDARRVRRR